MRYTMKKDRLYYGGNERVRYKIEYPVFDEYEEISAFFDKIAQNCVEYCKGELYLQACRSGEKCVYAFSARVTHWDGGAVSVLISVALTGLLGERRQTVRALTWDTATRLMMPPDIIIGRYGKKEAGELRKKEVFLRNGRVYAVDKEFG